MVYPIFKKSINYLHHFINEFSFLKANMWARIGGKDGADLVRSTFAVLLKHSQNTQQFQEFCDDIELEEEKLVVLFLIFYICRIWRKQREQWKCFEK